MADGYIIQSRKNGIVTEYMTNKNIDKKQNTGKVIVFTL